MIECKMCLALTQVSKSDQTTINYYLDNNEVPKTDIAKVLTSHGYPMSEAAVRRHINNHRSNS